MNEVPAMLAPARKQTRLKHIVLIAALSIAAITPVWSGTYFPSQNGPWHLLAARMLVEYDNPELDYAECYTPNWRAIPHILHTVLVYVLGLALPILTANKLALTIYALLLPASVFYFLAIAAPERKVLGYFSFLMVHQFTFYRGYHDFCLSIPLFFFALAFWIRHRESLRDWKLLVLAMLAALVYFAHLFTFLLLVCSIGWYRLVETHSVGRAIVSAGLATWPGFLLLADFIAFNLSSSQWIDVAEREWLRPHTAVEYFIRKFFYTTSVPAYVIGVAGFTWIVYLVGRRLRHVYRGGRTAWLAACRDPYLTMLIVLGCGYFLVPWKFMNWHYVNARMIPFTMVLALAAVGSLPIWRRGAFQRIFLVTVCVGAFAIDALMVREVVRLNRSLKEYTSGIAAVERDSTLLPVHLENPRFGQIRPLTRAHEYYQIEKGGENPIGAALFNTIVPIRYRHYPVTEMLPKYDPQAPDESMRSIAATYDVVLVWGRGTSPAVERLDDVGFNVVYSTENLRVFRNRLSPRPAPIVPSRQAALAQIAGEPRARPSQFTASQLRGTEGTR